MTSTKPRRTQSRPLAPEGRAQTVQTSLSPPQAAWVASRGVPVAAYLRGLVEADMGPGMSKALELVQELLDGGMSVKDIQAHLWAHEVVGRGPPVVDRYQPAVGDRVDLCGYRGTVRAIVDANTIRVDYDDGDLDDESTAYAVKIGGDV